MARVDRHHPARLRRCRSGSDDGGAGPRLSANGARQHDVVLFGATGFTGGLTAEYLAANAPDGTRWALAGRNAAKLEAVRARLADTNPACAELDLLHADVEDASSIREVAEQAQVVITTVGPYIR